MRFLCTTLAGIVFIVLVYARFGPMNGPSYFRWPWYRTGNVAITAALLFLAASPALIAQVVAQRSRRLAIGLIAVTPALLQLTAIHLWPPPLRGMQRAAAVIVHPMATSYFTVAERVAGQSTWLRDFHLVLQSAPMHAATKPPGPVGFFVAVIHLFGISRAPLAAAWIMAAFGCAAVVAIYASFQAIAGPDIGLNGATMLALVPSMTAIYPQMDWLYAVFSVAALALWHVALASNSRRAAAAFGAVVFIMSLFTYSLLVLGATCVWMAIAYGRRSGDWLTVEIASRIAAAVIIGSYFVFCATTGFDPLRSFQTALERQASIIHSLNATHWAMTGQMRIYPRTILGDLEEFPFGLGWMTVVMAMTWLLSRSRETAPAIRATAIAALATPVIVAISGLLAAETARVWIFLMPLVILPAALEISNWKPAERFVTYVLMIGCAIAVYSNAAFQVI